MMLATASSDGGAARGERFGESQAPGQRGQVSESEWASEREEDDRFIISTAGVGSIGECHSPITHF